MRCVMVLVTACLCMLASTSLLALQFPYTVKVAAETPYYGQAKISGAAAGQLPPGSAVEVYRHDGDWLAIRPPAGSFSWVSSRNVEATSQPNVVRVRTGGVTCWVGHAGSENRTVSQVTLEQGELLQVTGDSLVGNETEVQQWYRIAPPAGEFRFVHSRHIHATPPAAPAGNGAALLTAGWSTRGKAGVAPQPTAASQPIAAQPIAQVGVQNAAAINPAPSTPLQAIPTATSVPAATTQVASAAETQARQRLATVDSHLATMLAYPPSMWNPMAVVPELQTLTATAPTAERDCQSDGASLQ